MNERMKYELTDETKTIDDNGYKRTLHRIRALRDIPCMGVNISRVKLAWRN